MNCWKIEKLDHVKLYIFVDCTIRKKWKQAFGLRVAPLALFLLSSLLPRLQFTGMICRKFSDPHRDGDTVSRSLAWPSIARCQLTEWINSEKIPWTSPVWNRATVSEAGRLIHLAAQGTRLITDYKTKHLICAIIGEARCPKIVFLAQLPRISNMVFCIWKVEPAVSNIRFF